MFKKFSPKFYAGLLSKIVCLWSTTLNYKQTGLHNVLTLRDENKRAVFALWHDELFPLFALHKNENLAAVVSKSKDGEILAQLLMRGGHHPVRGSSSRGGAAALRQAMRQMRNYGRDVVFTIDGPRGPRHKAKPGAIYLASACPALLMPVRIHIGSAWKFTRSWDKFQLPKPGAVCEVIYGEPYTIPSKLDERGLALEQEKLEIKMAQLKPRRV